MNILKIKDPQGNWVDIPALKGDKGDKGDPGISPTIDSTLSQANQAADAKAVGDKIDEITLTIDETLTQSGQVADAKVTGDALNTKADQNGYYENLNVGVADQLASKNYIEDNEAYTFRPTANGAKVGTREFDMIVGGSVVWNQHSLNTRATTTTNGITFTNNGDGSITVDGTATAVTTFNSVEQSGDTAQLNHVYLIRGCPSKGNYDTYFLQQPMMSGRQNADSGAGKVYKHTSSATRILTQIYVSNGTTVTNAIFKPQFFDLTQMFGSEIADRIYSLEQATAGAGVAWFRKYFPNDYYDYNPGELMHVSGVSAHKTYDADENVIGNYPLDSSLTLRGIPKLVNGKLTFNGDIYKPDGTVERRYEIMTLNGSESWLVNSVNSGLYYITFSTSSGVKSNGKIFSNKFISTSITGSEMTNGQMKIVSTNINFKTPYATLEEWKDALALNPVIVIYELATPATEEATPYQSPQIIDPYGTEEYVTTSIVPVGHQTQYPEDLRAKIESLPWDFANLIAPVEVTYIATRNYTAGSLFIINNILYKATANIANGGIITPNTNCIPTTLAEIIAAL